MHGTGGFPFDIVLFAAIALFLGLRLRSILGTRTGFEGAPPAPAAAPVPMRPAPVVEAEAAPAPQARALPDPASPLGRTLAAMKNADSRFDPAHFLAGAEGAFRLIVAAFSEGDRERLRPLLSEDTYRAFDAAITARTQAGQTQRTEIREILDVRIEDGRIFGSLASLTVRFVSRQINLTLGPDGEPVAGTDAITEMADLWTFERGLASPDLAWRLTAARSA